MNRNLCHLVATLLLLCAAGCQEAPQKASFAESYVQISTENPHYFQLSNGDYYIPIGCNIAAIDSRESMETYMKALHDNGANYARVWLNSALFEIEKVYGEWDETSLSNLDRLFELATLYDIKLKLCIESFRHIREGRNEWDTKASYHTSNGGPFKDMMEYLDTDRGRNEYLRRLNFLKERYGDHPAVFGWELWNEMNAVEHRDSRELYDWNEYMLAKVKEMFPRNLVMQSLGSYDSEWCVEDYKYINALPDNEVSQVHRYIDQGAKFPVCFGPEDLMVSDAVGILYNMGLNKPILLAETGAVKPCHTGPHPMYDKDSVGVVLHDALFAGFFSGAAGPGHLWHWDHYIAKQNVWYQMQRFANAIQGFNPIAENPRPVRCDNDRLRVYALQGSHTALAWCRDIGSNWMTEFEQEIAPQSVVDASIDLTPLIEGRRIKSVEVYDPWQDSWTKLPKKSEIVLPDFQRSTVVRIAYK